MLSLSLSQGDHRDSTLSLTMSTSYSTMSTSCSATSTTTQPPILRVYSRRPRDSVQSPLPKESHSLDVSDLQINKETCREANNQGAVPDPTPAADPVTESLEEKRERILVQLKELHDMQEDGLDVYAHYLVHEARNQSP